jgi:hypothetical protein
VAQDGALGCAVQEYGHGARCRSVCTSGVARRGVAAGMRRELKVRFEADA